MVKFLIATHGFLADGFKSSISVIMGKETAEKIETINAFVEGGIDDPKTAIEQYCNDLSNDDELLILTDIMYGSVNQFALPLTKKKNVHILTGINFPIVCEIVSKLSFGENNLEITKSMMDEIIKTAQNEMIYVEDFTGDKLEDKEEDFF